MITAVLFDMDGLMVDTESLATTAWQEAAKKQGFTMSVEETLYVLGVAKKSIYSFWQDYYKDRPEIDTNKLVDDHYKYIEDVVFGVGPKKMPYVEKLLRYLKANDYKIAVASSSDLHHINNNMEKTKLSKYIDVVASGEEVKESKPAPDVFLLAAKRLGVKAENCLVLEDSKYGVMAAKKAGMTAILVPDMFTPDEEVKNLADNIVKNLNEIITILKNKEI